MKDPDHLEIGSTDGARRWRGFTGWLLFYLAVGAALVAAFIRFTGSVLWATCLVAFMLIYMTIMGRFAGGKINRRP